MLRRAVTVHSVGGVPMGIDRTHGVIDEYGEVHGHRGLYVIDGAAVPSATGVNPSASILAMAERNVERAIRRIIGAERWEAQEMPDVTRADVNHSRQNSNLRSRTCCRRRGGRAHHRRRRVRPAMTGRSEVLS